MNDENQSEANVLGIYINHKENIYYPPLPEWVKDNKICWAHRGVIVWDESTNKILSLFPQQALDVLDDLKEWTVSTDELFCLDWNSYIVPLSEEDRIAWRKTKNRRNHSPGQKSASRSLMLSPQQAKVLLLFLEKRKAEICELGNEHEKETSKAIAHVLATFARAGRKHRIKAKNPLD